MNSLSSGFETQFSWLKQPHMQKLIEVMSLEPSHKFKFVGGAVRDSLLGITPNDFDLCSNLLPEQNIANFRKNKIHTVNIAKSYGTITAVIQGVEFQITTLRKDVLTKGRAAEVSFTDDFAQDAARRDFTINALYLCPKTHEITDYFDGLTDLKHKYIRFIGSAEDRVKEDYLRILRFIRFYAFIGSTNLNDEYISTLKRYRNNLSRLSCERIYIEVSKILKMKVSQVLNAVQIFNKSLVGEQVFSQTTLFSDNLNRLSNLIKKHEITPESYLIKLICMIDDIEGVKYIFFKRKDKHYLSNMQNALKELKAIETSLSHEISQLSYLFIKFSSGILIDALLVNLSRHESTNCTMYNLLKTALNLKSFTAPYSPSELISMGIKPGPSISKLLNELKMLAAEYLFNHQKLPDKSAYSNIIQSACNTIDI